ncbi:succinylglutamate desuccinylase/aspartoacylase family protein [Gymnodinialimonas ceratoperidinii]|uniref:Succinylglutamate desuccinylase/aspartoacylase family protein n=1 Tax=Gymnodinialimonas ceratoperidinii TaxID=2856823 RepID=A0A8F6YBM3_9RHOB|nr:M14 family metallopeptidase [Gymnodinialimonas ceratoperidinii]QXT40266.1 succinylglutamate desuccinylase/aspartoacylase family protein [Gymnodinialimonas ceratoperidinii]
MSTYKNDTLTVGTATAKPGEVVRGGIPTVDLAGGVKVEIPVVVINGAEAGPTFWVNAAIHGDEPEGPLACALAVKQIDPAKLSGAVVLVPCVNPLAFSAAERGNPLDTFAYDMNRIYPGKANGYFSDRIANAHWEAMKDVADLEISIHSGGAHSFLDKAIFVDERPESVELAKAMGEGWGCIMSNFTKSGSPMAAMNNAGKVGITVELGGRSYTSPERFRYVGEELAKSIVNICYHYDMLDGTATYPDDATKGQQEALLAPASGIFLPEPGVDFLTMMKKGDTIARIINIFGDEVGELKAPADGMFFGLRALPNVNQGDWCCFFNKVEGPRD